MVLPPYRGQLSQHEAVTPLIRDDHKSVGSRMGSLGGFMGMRDAQCPGRCHLKAKAQSRDRVRGVPPTAPLKLFPQSIVVTGSGKLAVQITDCVDNRLPNQMVLAVDPDLRRHFLSPSF